MNEEERRRGYRVEMPPMFLDYVEDKELTEAQQSLKWSIYCECEMETNCDVKEVLKSLLNDSNKIEKKEEEDDV